MERVISIIQASDADVLIKVGTGTYYGAALIGAAAGTLKIYDAASVATIADAKLIGGCGVTAASDADHDHTVQGIRFTLGLVAVVTGAGNLAQVRYK
jgi:hypothetical protein